VQVALSQLAEVRADAPNRQALQNRFFRLVADFVLCRHDFSVVAVIELDDSYHAARDRKDADQRKAKAVESAGLRLVRIPAGPIPSEAALRELIGGGGNEFPPGIGTRGFPTLPEKSEAVATLLPFLGLGLI